MNQLGEIAGKAVPKQEAPNKNPSQVINDGMQVEIKVSPVKRD